MRQMAAGARIARMPHIHVTIAHLLEHPHLVPVLAEQFIEEWRPWYGPDGDGDAEADLLACDSRDALPVCLIALDEDGNLLGTIAIRETSVGSDVAEGPWLTGLLVAPENRGKGVGTALVAALESEADRLGFKALYTSTDAADGIMRRRGWENIGSSLSLRGEVAVFRKSLGAG